ncbi:DUF6401 family natural product biosynthesis protein [Nocardia blacklockiae]|uniref:DUF6401 family natural product biosynthesis protein n=1 Tax=Nocardia blacklockiae TaxID=480036 RepID=UPI001892DA29|nr:DUF6401 family natural product biosynthesis protein [Nocardia blacklockiae]MBF6171187.1 hypothetical protein [Nocardia blacklockiae]
MFLLGSALLEVSARKTLNRLHKTHGVPALAAARELPAVSAALDQHAAAVRDILDLGVRDAANAPAGVLLAGYARGLLEHSGRPGPRAPYDLIGWAQAEWLPLRLAAVCMLAHTKV